MDIELDNKQWYVLYVNVRHEKKVFERFLELDIESYLPLIKNIKQWSDRKKVIAEPLFTGYIFVKLMPHELDKPLYMPGVINYLTFGKQKAIVKQREIDSLAYLIESGYLLNTNLENVQIGSKVKLLLSSFKNEIAIVHSIKDDNAVIYFESLNQYIKVITPISVIELVKQ